MHPAISTQQQRTQQTTSKKWRGAGLTAQQPTQGKIERHEKGRVYSPAETPSKQETKDKAKVRGGVMRRSGCITALPAKLNASRQPDKNNATAYKLQANPQQRLQLCRKHPGERETRKRKTGKVLRLSGCNIALPAILSAGRQPIEAMRIACYGLQASSKLNTLPPSQNKKKHETGSSRV